MDGKARYVVSGTELGRAPTLAPCPCCGGIADYVNAKADGDLTSSYIALCSECGLKTAPHPWPGGAGRAWNRRITSGARLITTGEIAEYKRELTDERGRCACWLETITGDVRAVMIESGTSMDGREIYDVERGDYWSRDEVEAEGVKWRIWDRKPTEADRQAAQWGRMWHGGFSEAAEAEAKRVCAALEEKRRAEEQRRAEAMRRRCLYCANYVPVDTEGKDLGSAAPFVCGLDGHIVVHPSSENCGSWKSNREGE